MAALVEEVEGEGVPFGSTLAAAHGVLAAAAVHREWSDDLPLIVNGTAVTLSTAAELLKLKVVDPKRGGFKFEAVFGKRKLVDCGFHARMDLETILKIVRSALRGGEPVTAQIEDDGDDIKLVIDQQFYAFECKYILPLSRKPLDASDKLSADLAAVRSEISAKDSVIAELRQKNESIAKERDVALFECRTAKGQLTAAKRDIDSELKKLSDNLRAAEQREKLAKSQANDARLENEKLCRENERLLRELSEALFARSSALKSSIVALKPMASTTTVATDALDDWDPFGSTSSSEVKVTDSRSIYPFSDILWSSPPVADTHSTVLTQDIKLLYDLYTTNSAMLFDSIDLKIGFKAMLDPSNGIMRAFLYYLNSGSERMTDIKVEVLNPSPAVDIKFIPQTFALEASDKLQQKCRVLLMQPITEVPKLRICYKVNDRVFGTHGVVLRCILPVIASKFFTPHSFEAYSFASKWSKLKMEESRTVKLKTIATLSLLKKIVRDGMHMAVISGVCDERNEFGACAVYHFASKKGGKNVAMPVILKTQLRSAEMKVKLTVRTPHKAATQSAMFAFTEVFGRIVV